jgi:hypothetical protein
MFSLIILDNHYPPYPPNAVKQAGLVFQKRIVLTLSFFTAFAVTDCPFIFLHFFISFIYRGLRCSALDFFALVAYNDGADEGTFQKTEIGWAVGCYLAFVSALDGPVL